MESIEISQYLKNLKFKKNFIGGLDEEDVWKKIRKLDEMYQKERFTLTHSFNIL